MEKYSVLGIMSGSSLDGVDLAFCDFVVDENKNWKYEINKAETVKYDDDWKRVLKELPFAAGHDLIKYDVEYGKKLAEISGQFLSKHNLIPNFLASHGHTIFHRPDEGFTFQLGNGQALSSASGFTVVSDFRTKDIQLGGQGAPLVPLGDELLFSEYDICLNIGGIANISFRKNDERLAFDVCPANQMLNHLANENGLEYDPEGELAKSGELNKKLFDVLNNDPFYSKPYPKSLSNEYVREHFISLLEKNKASIENKLATTAEHIAFQISTSTLQIPEGKMLITGGGAFNSYLVKRIKKLTKHQIVLPETSVIDYKEAMIFGLLGVLKMRNEINCLSTVTGATKDSSTGSIFQP